MHRKQQPSARSGKKGHIVRLCRSFLFWFVWIALTFAYWQKRQHCAIEAFMSPGSLSYAVPITLTTCKCIHCVPNSMQEEASAFCDALLRCDFVSLLCGPYTDYSVAYGSKLLANYRCVGSIKLLTYRAVFRWI